MKKTALFVFAAFLMFSFASCKSGAQPIEASPEPAVTLEPAVTPPRPIPLTPPPASPDPTPEIVIPDGDHPVYTLTILHTNDWHGILDDVPKYATLIREIRGETENVLLLDGGDIFRRGPFEQWMGVVETEVMNAMGYDALTFGNSDYPQSDRELADCSQHPILQTAEFPVLCANVTIGGQPIEGFEPTVILTVGELDIAVIGVTSMKPDNRGMDISKQAVFTDPPQVVAEQLGIVKDISDIQIVLSHAGIVKDREMSGVSAIIGADDHLRLERPAVIYDGERYIPIVQAGGEENHFLGRLDLTFYEIGGEWVLGGFEGRLLQVNGVLPDPDIQQIIDSYWAALELAA